MLSVFLDTETIPCQKPGIMDEIMAGVSAPGNITKPESIKKWMDENAESKAEEIYRKTALDGTLGEITCLAWAVEDESVLSLDRSSNTEALLLGKFFSFLAERVSNRSDAMFVGHNILGFDLRFLFQRAVINRVPLPFRLHQDARYNGDHVFDTMLAWAGWGKYVSLPKVCDALGIPVKTDGFSGADVWDLIKSGQHEAVSGYCREDVEAVREVYRRMTFNGMTMKLAA